MALRTFHANPSIGGFGGENSLDLRRNRAGKSAPDEENDQENPGGDVFCQIVKELVENAIDACSSKEIHSEDQTGATNRRVKVEIQPWDDQSENEELLLKVSDNGVGMENIQNAVDAFQSSKENSQSAGRYGIGLTLSLLHAQRLVSNSYAVITSGTKDAAHFTRAWYVVNSVGDSITCYKQEDVRKANETESGTCVSLLVPVSPLRCYFVPNNVKRKWLRILVDLHLYVMDTLRAGHRLKWPGLVSNPTSIDFN